MSFTLGGALALGGMSALGSIAGGYLSGQGAEQATAAQIAWERERAKNAHQWEVEDLKKAGLNPILSAGGQGAATGSIDAINKNEGYANALNNIGNSAMAIAQMKFDVKKQQAEIDNINANTARTLSLLPEEIKTHKWNRIPHAVKEFGGTAITASEIADEFIHAIEKKWNNRPGLMRKKPTK